MGLFEIGRVYLSSPYNSNQQTPSRFSSPCLLYKVATNHHPDIYATDTNVKLFYFMSMCQKWRVLYLVYLVILAFILPYGYLSFDIALPHAPTQRTIILLYTQWRIQGGNGGSIPPTLLKYDPQDFSINIVKFLLRREFLRICKSLKGVVQNCFEVPPPLPDTHF